MKKKLVRVLILIAFMCGMQIQAGGENVFVGWEKEKGDSVKSLIQSTEADNDTIALMEVSNSDIKESVTLNPDYKVLNADLLGREFICEGWGELLIQGAYAYSEGVKGEFIPVVSKRNSFPEELVVMMEDILYHSSNKELRDDDNSCYYDGKLKEFGAGSFLLGLEDAYQQFPKIAEHQEQIECEKDAYKQIEEVYVGKDSENCYEIHHFFAADGQEFFLFCYYTGGRESTEYLHLMKRAGEELILVQTLYKKSHGRAELIQYDGEFYYVYLEFNQYLKGFEGINVCRLNESPGENTNMLQICFTPVKYVWKDLRTSFYTEEGENMETYMRDVKRELLALDEADEEFGRPVHYLEFGERYGLIHTYFGDEKEADSFDLKDSLYVNEGISGDIDTVYKMDIANCGTPLYISKHMKAYDDRKAYLDIRYLYYDSQTASYEELDRLGYSNGGVANINLVQTWFKEIGGKSYTCQVYHVGEFNYIFQMILLDGTKASTICTALIAPQREFVVTDEVVENQKE